MWGEADTGCGVGGDVTAFACGVRGEFGMEESGLSLTVPLVVTVLLLFGVVRAGEGMLDGFVDGDGLELVETLETVGVFKTLVFAIVTILLGSVFGMDAILTGT